MLDLIPLTALGGQTPATFRHGALELVENSGLALASLALRKGGDTPRPFGLELPAAGGWHAANGLSAFWTGPGQWMIEASERAETDFAAELKAACPACSVTEQTDGFVAFEIRSHAGAAPIERLLEKLVNIDLARFGAGHATRTGFEHMSIFVIRRADDALAVVAMRTAAASVWHGLHAAIERIAT